MKISHPHHWNLTTLDILSPWSAFSKNSTGSPSKSPLYAWHFFSNFPSTDATLLLGYECPFVLTGVRVESKLFPSVQDHACSGFYIHPDASPHPGVKSVLPVFNKCHYLIFSLPPPLVKIPKTRHILITSHVWNWCQGTHLPVNQGRSAGWHIKEAESTCDN